MIYAYSLPMLGLLLLSLPLKSYSSSITRYRTNLIFYGGYSTAHRSVLYSNSEIEDWKNLTHLAQVGGLQEKALLCGLGMGAWLAYPKANFKSEINESNYVLLISGDTCVPADNINSVQAIGPINKEPIGLITFKETYFTLGAFWLTNETNSASEVKSFICPSDLSGEWTVEGDGRKVCIVRPKEIIATGVCIFPDLPTQLNMQSATITVGCPEDSGVDKEVVVLQTCFGSFGAFKIIDNYLPLPGIIAICKDNADDAHKIGFVKILDAWKYRMDPERQEEMNPADIDKSRQDENMPWRMKVLTYFFAIFKAGCPNVPEIYFNLLRYLFMRHLKTVWEEVPQILTDKNETTLSWKSATEYMEKCYQQRLGDPVTTIPEEIRCIEKPRYDDHDEADFEESALDLFLSGDTLDHIIEQVWLILNYVSPYCSASDRFRDNKWAEFTTLFRRNFLLPLLQQWVHPGTWQVLYDYMFNGFSIPKEKRQIISCVQDMILRTPTADPVDRPSANVEEFVNLSKKKKPVEIELDGTSAPSETTTAPSKTTAKKSRRKRSPKEHLTALQLISRQKAILEEESEHGGLHKARRLSHGR